MSFILQLFFCYFIICSHFNSYLHLLFQIYTLSFLLCPLSREPDLYQEGLLHSSELTVKSLLQEIRGRRDRSCISLPAGSPHTGSVSSPKARAPGKQPCIQDPLWLPEPPSHSQVGLGHSYSSVFLALCSMVSPMSSLYSAHSLVNCLFIIVSFNYPNSSVSSISCGD